MKKSLRLRAIWAIYKQDLGKYKKCLRLGTEVVSIFGRVFKKLLKLNI